jgi:hypothetical protein
MSCLSTKIFICLRVWKERQFFSQCRVPWTTKIVELALSWHWGDNFSPRVPCQWHVSGAGGGEGKRRILIGQSVPPPHAPQLEWHSDFLSCGLCNPNYLWGENSGMAWGEAAATEGYLGPHYGLPLALVSPWGPNDEARLRKHLWSSKEPKFETSP